MNPLPRSFFDRPADAIAPDLLGKILCVDGARCRIVETEAYVGVDDLACHAAKGRTARTEVLFGPPGHAYVYFVYGMHDMLNVVAGPPGHAVLLRAAEGLGAMADARLDGPGRLTRALGVTVATHNRMPVDRPPLWFEDGPPPEVTAAPRIGVDYAGPWAAAPLRFLDASSPAVSKPAPKTPGPARPSPMP